MVAREGALEMLVNFRRGLHPGKLLKTNSESLKSLPTVEVIHPTDKDSLSKKLLRATAFGEVFQKQREKNGRLLSFESNGALPRSQTEQIRGCKSRMLY